MVEEGHNHKTASALTRLEEQRLIAALKNGDQSVVAELVDHHKQRLYAFIWRIVPNQQDAEDICQDAFIKALSAIDTFDPKYRFSTWLFTIAYRLALNLLRRKNNNAGEVDFTRFESDTEPDVNDIAQTEEAERLKQDVWGAVESLSGPQRAAIVLFYRESLSCQEIADVMDTPVATVKSHLFRARARLKELLEPIFAGDWGNLRILSECVA